MASSSVSVETKDSKNDFVSCLLKTTSSVSVDWKSEEMSQMALTLVLASRKLVRYVLNCEELAPAVFLNNALFPGQRKKTLR